MPASDDNNICAIYESIQGSCIVRVDDLADAVTQYNSEDSVELILQKIDKLTRNAENFNDAGGIVALTALKQFIEDL